MTSTKKIKWLEKRRRYEEEEAWREFSVGVFIVTPHGIPIVVRRLRVKRSDGESMQFLPKLPGGKGQLCELPPAAACREVKEELGIMLDQDELEFLYFKDYGDYDKFFYRATSDQHPTKTITNAQEKVVLPSPRELLGGLHEFPLTDQEAIVDDLVELCYNDAELEVA